MMCQEVIELMQRYLDRDLEEPEYRRMLQHLQQCPDCTELFERLVNLSHELESLPKVTPPFSLVDAIMPKLEQLEASGEAPGADLRIVQAEADAGAQTGADERKAPGGWRKHIREWISFPFFGGVVAAGLVVGFFLFNQSGSRESDAGKLMLSLPGAEQNAGSKADSKASAPAADNQAKNESAGGSGQEAANSRVMQDQNAPAGDAKKGAPSSEPAPQVQKPAPKATEPTSKPSAAGSLPTANSVEPQRPESTPAPATGPSASGAAPGTEASDQKAQQPAGDKKVEPKSFIAAPSAADGSRSGGGEAPETGSAGQTAGQTPAADQRSAETPGPNASASKVGGGGQYGIAAIPSAPQPATELATTDGAYKAAIADGRVTVYDKQGKAAYQSKYEWKDGGFKIELVDWSADYKLTYRVKTSDQVRTFVIAMKSLTETESKP